MVDSFSGPQSRRLGEVVETSTVRIWTECDNLNELPRLGSVVEIATLDNGSIISIVSFCETAGIDSTRRAVRRGSDEMRDDEVYRRHPELTRVLRSTFESVPVAYDFGGKLRYVVPPVPPPLHYSVVAATSRTMMALTNRLDYLDLLARYTGEVAAEQMIIAHVREAFEARGRDHQWLEVAAAEIGRIYSRQYDLLLPVLQAIDPGQESAPVDQIRS